MSFTEEHVEIATMQHVVLVKECRDIRLAANAKKAASVTKTVQILILARLVALTILRNAIKIVRSTIRAPRIVQFLLILAIKHVLILTGAIATPRV